MTGALECTVETFISSLTVKFSLHNAFLLVANWWITAAVSTSTLMLLLVLEDLPSLYAFVVLTVSLGLVLPAWKYATQGAKVLLRGPWDIPTAASMQLDYTVPATHIPTSG
jgi:hypothetical protein